jgi:ribosomal protein S18 acetylase RimI-like enzyme
MKHAINDNGSRLIMLSFLKGIFTKNRGKSQIDTVVSDLRGNYISLARLEHAEFIVGQILEGSRVGNYNRSYAQAPEMLLPGLEHQVRESIQHNQYRPNNEEVVVSVISIGHCNNEVSGFCWSTNPSENTYELHMLSVKEDRRRAGLGKALLLDAIASYPEGSQVIARIYKDEFKTDRSRSMLNMLTEEGFEESLEQPNTRTTLFSKRIPT